MRRWTRRILLGLIIVIAVVLITVQIVLWTDYPRRLVLQLVQQQLGLRVEANSMSTGWFGRTTLHDVRLSLPLAQESFLDMPRLTVSHTALLPLLITQKFQLQSLGLEKPTLIAQRDAAGRWNLQDVAELVARAGAGTPEPGTKKRPPKLPRLRVTDGAIAIIERGGARTMIKPLTVTGDPDGSLVYRYDAEVPDNQLKAVGQIAPGEDFKHEVHFVIKPREWLTPWMKNPPTPLRLDAKWTGIVRDGTVTGRLIIEDAQLETYGARGRVVIQAGRGATVINPQDLTVTTKLDIAPTVKFASGTVQLDGPAMTVQQLRVGALGGHVQLDGTGDLAARTADLFGTWRELVSPGQIVHSGNLHITVKNASPGRPEVAAEIVSRGQFHRGTWDGQITAAGAGRNFSEMDWTVKVPRVTWAGKLPWEIKDVTMNVTQRDSQLTLTQLQWPTAELLTAHAEYNVREQKWLARVRGRGILPERANSAAASLPFDFNLDGFGDPERIHLNEMFVNARGLRLKTTGDYVRGTPEPVSLSVYLTHVPSDVLSPEDLPIEGRLHSEGHIAGTLEPLALRFVGVVRSEDLVVSKRDFGDMRGVIQGSFNGVVAQFDVRDLALLGGQWTIKGAWPYEEKDQMLAGSPLHIIVGVEQLSLKEVGELFRTPGVKGSLAGSWTIDINKPRRDLLAMKGSFKASDVAFNQIDADEVTGEMNLKNGTLHVDPIRLRKGEKGQATAAIETTLADARKPQLTLSTVEWPVTLGPTSFAAVWGETQLLIDARQKSAVGPIKARMTIATTQQSLGEANVAGKIAGRSASLDQIELKGIDGNANGRLFVNADKPDDTNGVLTWSGISGERLAELVPKLNGLAGAYGGTLTIDPDTSDRALEPLRVRVELSPQQGKFRALNIGPIKLSAFVDLDASFGLQRIVLDELPSEEREERRREAELDEQNVPPTSRPLAWNDIRIADGRIKLWARRGQHLGGDVTTHFIVNFEHLDVNEIVHAIKPDADPMPSRLSGEIIMHGNAASPEAILGHGHVRITESDLAKVDALELLYNLMSLGSAPKTPNGAGSLDLTLQHSTLTLQNIRYFNRGVEAWSSDVTISDVWKIPNSPINGYVVGSARPLSALKLPLIADVDQILSVLQSNLTTVRIDGTVAHPKVKQSTFSDVGSGLKQFLSGEVTKTRK